MLYRYQRPSCGNAWYHERSLIVDPMMKGGGEAIVVTTCKFVACLGANKYRSYILSTTHQYVTVVTKCTGQWEHPENTTGPQRSFECRIVTNIAE
jgi:hypothetical protein